MVRYSFFVATSVLKNLRSTKRNPTFHVSNVPRLKDSTSSGHVLMVYSPTFHSAIIILHDLAAVVGWMNLVQAAFTRRRPELKN
jgi:hypothetical protein